MPIKRKMGVLCTTPSIASPRSSGTRKTAANRKASPKSSIPDGPWPPVPRSPVGDIPRKVYEKPVIGLRVFVRPGRCPVPEVRGADCGRQPQGAAPGVEGESGGGRTGAAGGGGGGKEGGENGRTT